MEQITDHADRAIDGLRQQFRNKPNFEDLLRILIEPFQDLESFFFQILNDFNIEAGYGQLLDQIGREVVQARGGYSDANYKVLLKLKEGANISKGGHQPLAGVIKEVTSSSFVQITEDYPAKVVATVDGNNLDSEFLYLVERIVSLGVGVALASISAFPPFAFEGDSDAGGFGTLYDPLIGGHFIDRVEI